MSYNILRSKFHFEVIMGRWDEVAKAAKKSEGDEELENSADSFDKPLELKKLLDTEFDPVDLPLEIAEKNKESEKNDIDPELTDDKDFRPL